LCCASPLKTCALVDGLRADLTFLPSDITAAMLLPAVRADWQQWASFCADNTATGFQIDIYLVTGRPFEVAQFQRAQTIVNIHN
jgi:hypothetical protein